MRVDVLLPAVLGGMGVLGCSHLDDLGDLAMPPDAPSGGPTALTDGGTLPADAASPVDASISTRDGGDGGPFDSGVDAYVPPPVRYDAGPLTTPDAGPPDGGRKRFEVTGSVAYDTTQQRWWQAVLPLSYTGCTGTYVGRSACTFTQAMNYCDSLVLGPYSDWSVPTLDELRTLVSPGSFPLFDANTFPNTPLAFFWTRSYPSGTLGTSHYSVGFADGDSSSTWSNNSNMFVRCVRPSRP